MNPFQEFHGRLSDFFYPGLKLTANELRVLIVLRAVSPSRCGIAVIDLEEIAEITEMEMPHISRAISSLRSKGMIRRTWMDEVYSNVYPLWVPDEILDQDAAIQHNDLIEANKNKKS